MFGNRQIRNKILNAINAKIDEMEVKYEEGCEDIDMEARSQKAKLENDLIHSILGKIL